MASKNVKFHKIRSSITFMRRHAAFWKSQTSVDLSAWFHIKKQVLREVAEADKGVVRLPLSKAWKGKVQCPFCPKVQRPHISIGSIALADHVRDKHPQNAKLVIRA
ncbi:hypothetical protein BD410DRAFT_840250 [Rickenella mellea]|nr:hypothetical protein BD410DRAFT_840250 [Rickenella mellea]